MNRMTVLMIAVLAVAASGCGAGPEDVATEFQNAINSQDTDSVLSLLVDDAVWQVDGTSHRTGKTEIEDWLATQTELNLQIKGEPTSTESGVAFQSCSISSDMWGFFGVNPMTGTCQLALEAGLITGFVVQFDDDSRTRLSDSPAAASAEILGIWRTRNYLTDSGDLFLQFLEQGRGRLVGSSGDSIPAADSDFEGASLTWTYKDYVLTIQNEGLASDKYCQEQDVGIYLVKLVDAGGLKFKAISDSCSLRGIAVPLPPRWRPHLP